MCEHGVLVTAGESERTGYGWNEWGGLKWLGLRGGG